MAHEIKKEISKGLVFLIAFSAISLKINADIASGKDSILNRTFSRYIDGMNEERYQEYLGARRRDIANRLEPERINWIKLLSFPNDINYDDYKQK